MCFRCTAVTQIGTVTEFCNNYASCEHQNYSSRVNMEEDEIELVFTALLCLLLFTKRMTKALQGPSAFLCCAVFEREKKAFVFFFPLEKYAICAGTKHFL